MCAGGTASAQSLEDRFILPRYFHLRECRSGGRQLRARIRASYGCSIWISTSQSSQMSRFAPAQASTPYDPCCPLRLLHTADFASSVCSGRNATNFWRQVLFQSAYDARLSPDCAFVRALRLFPLLFPSFLYFQQGGSRRLEPESCLWHGSGFQAKRQSSRSGRCDAAR